MKGPWQEDYRSKYFSSPRVQENIQRFKVHVSKPKSEQHKEKLRQAKINKELSEHHRASLSEAQRLRQQIRREIQESEPEISQEELWARVREKYHEYTR